jgi:hypothetical protein
VVLILFGLASGFVFGDMVSHLVNDSFDINMSAFFAGVILSIIGVISGATIAHSLEDKYTHANNSFPWLLIGLPVLVIPLGVALILGLVVGLVIAVFSFIIQLIGAILLVICACSVCGGS